MTANFEHYAEQRIPRLREQAAALTAEADALAKALAAFRSANRTTGGVAITATLPTVTPAIVTNTGRSISGGRQMQEGSQSSNILATLDRAGDAGCSLSDIYAALAQKGVTNKASIRSVVWSLKKAHRIAPYGDRYFAAYHAPHKETAVQSND